MSIALNQLINESTLFIPRHWRKIVVRSNGYCDHEACVILAELINSHWIKDKDFNPTGLKDEWQAPTVITREKLQDWQRVYCFSHKVSQKHLDRLTELELLLKTNPTPEQIKKILSQKKPQRFEPSFFSKTCEWCQGVTAHLHSHHYPKPKRLGGTETVSICPNCHSEFHALEHISAYSLTDKVLEEQV